MRHIIALALAGTLTSATTGGVSVAELGDQEVPVLGSTTLAQDMESAGVKATVLVNGVRRIDGATIVYYSAGLPKGAPAQSWSTFNSSASDRVSSASGGVGNVRLIDFPHQKIYLPLVKMSQYGSEQALVSPSAAWPSDEPGGTFYTFYAVMPELPDDVGTVDVMVGHGDIVQDVKVDEGVMEPASLQEKPIRMGQVWPLIDQVAAAGSAAPEDSVRPLIQRSTQEGQ